MTGHERLKTEILMLIHISKYKFTDDSLDLGILTVHEGLETEILRVDEFVRIWSVYACLDIDVDTYKQIRMHG